MANYAIVTDLNRCVGCLACTVACKVVNQVPVGNFWIKTMRVGPTPIVGGSGHFPDVEMYFLPMQCQHCENAPCVEVCPTGASFVDDDGTVQIDKDLCIGCQLCESACPYGVRYLNAELGVEQKCTMCQDRVEDGLLPQCVSQCCARARFFGDLDEGIDNFEGPAAPHDPKAVGYDDMRQERVKLKDYVEAYEESDIHHLADSGNGPKVAYLLRSPRTWYEDVDVTPALGVKPYNVIPA